MTDVFSSTKRSRIMRAIRSGDTGPEMIVRRMVFRLGYRYRVHVRSLAGTPDLVFVSRRKVICVHGCFWHLHTCRDGRVPSSRTEYWSPKLAANRRRDAKSRRWLRNHGWDVLVVWECQLANQVRLERRLRTFLGHRRPVRPASRITCNCGSRSH